MFVSVCEWYPHNAAATVMASDNRLVFINSHEAEFGQTEIILKKKYGKKKQNEK